MTHQTKGIMMVLSMCDKHQARNNLYI